MAKAKKVFKVIILTTILLAWVPNASAGDRYKVFIFGVDLNAFKDADWKKVAAGAVASVLVHELGHALYLESQGKDWEMKISKSGLAVQTDESLSEDQCRYFGRAGFLLQGAIGLILTSFEKTRRSDFTKGWIYMNTAQLWSYPFRSHESGDDFAMIAQGSGNPSSDLRLLSCAALYTTWRAQSSSPFFGDGKHFNNTYTTFHTGDSSSPSRQRDRHDIALFSEEHAAKDVYIPFITTARAPGWGRIEQEKPAQAAFLAAGTQKYSPNVRRVGYQTARGSDVVLSSVLLH